MTGHPVERVLLVTRNPSLYIGLSVIDRHWELASVGSPAELPEVPPQVVVYDVPLADLGAPPPARTVVLLDVGDLPSAWQGSYVVRRPFALSELVTAIDVALQPPVDQRRPAVELTAPPPAPGDDDPAAVRREPDEGDGTPSSAPPTDDPGLPDESEAADAPPEAGFAEVPRSARGELDPLFGGRDTASERALDAAPSSDASPLGDTEHAEAPEARLEDGAEGPAVPVGGPAPGRDTPDEDPGAEPAATDPPPTQPPPPITRRAARNLPSATAPESPATDAAPVRRRRLTFGGHARAGARTPPGLRQRIGRVLVAASDLEQLARDVPLLTDLDAMYDLVVDDVHDRLAADTAAFWVRDGDGWTVRAQRGLTPTERRLRVLDDQPLFHEIESTGGGLLIDPVDAVASAVAGIGGAHTATLAAAAVRAGPGDYGILAVGRNRALTGDDLDQLLVSIRDAVPALATALLLDQLGELTRGAGTAAREVSGDGHAGDDLDLPEVISVPSTSSQP